jgi:hypothetical protein
MSKPFISIYHHHPSTRTLPRATTSWHQQSLWRCSWLEAARQRDSRALSDLSLPPQVPLQCSRRPLFAHTPLLLDLHLLGSDCQSLRDGMRARSQRWIKRANTSSWLKWREGCTLCWNSSSDHRKSCHWVCISGSTVLRYCRYTIYYPFEKVQPEMIRVWEVANAYLQFRDQFLHVSEASTLCEGTLPVKSDALHASSARL